MKHLLLLCFVLLGSGIQAQNLLDEQGRKTGRWKVDHPNGKTLYEATFHQGNPVGEMIRYYDNGAVRARMMFDSSENRSFTRMFYKNGKIAAEGWYLDRVKDSVWTYYSEFDGSVRIREPYENGQLHGIVKSYYASGVVSEEVNWVHNQKAGTWKLYYVDGSMRMESQYENDLLNGPYEVFYADSTIKVKGHYVDDLNEGIWSFYNESGKEAFTIEYRNGEAVDEERFQQIMQDSLKKFDLISSPESDQHF